MPAEKYHKKALEEQIPSKLREQLRADGLSPNRLPTYEYLETTKYHPRGLSKAIKRHYGEDVTLHDYLREHGFGIEVNETWPTSHPKTIETLNGFKESRVKRNGDSEATIETLKPALRKVLNISQDLHETDNLLSYAQYDTEQGRQQNNRQILAILDELQEDLSDGAAANYIRYFRFFYEYAAIVAKVDMNPIDTVEGEYDLNPDSNSEAVEPSDEELESVWKKLKTLPEQDEFCDRVEHLIEIYGLEQWRIMMMALVLLGVGLGPRSGECEKMNCKKHWHLDQEPYIEFPDRKNQPGEVPIVSHDEFFKQYCCYLDSLIEDWNGRPFPSENSESGSRTATTLNNWLEALWIETGVRLPNGEYPTLQNLREKWHNEYLKVQRIREQHYEVVADERDKKDTEHIRSAYESRREKRETIRQLIRIDLEDMFPLSELPSEMKDEPDGQTTIEDF
jgi:hypothetical protein